MKCISVTFFPNQSAQSMRVKSMTLAELRDLIQTTNAKEKSRLPWLKLAAFGKKRTKKNSLRNDANVISITGIELDYDGKAIAFDKGLDVLRQHSLHALIYTSPSYTSAAPKWRALLPTSQPLAPEMRLELAKQVSEIFGGIFSNESFTLSQSYYYGSVAGNPEHRAVIVDGDYVDLHRFAIKTERQTKAENMSAHGEWAIKYAGGKGDEDWSKLIANILNGEELHYSIRDLAAKMATAGTGAGASINMLRAIMQQCSMQHDARWQERYDDISRAVESGQEKFKKEKDDDADEKFTAEAYGFPPENSLERYDWLSGRHLLRGQVCGTAAGGGTGKSSIAIVDALSMASGQQLLHDTVSSTPLRVVLINLEDDRNTMDKRIAAAMRHYGLKPEDIGDRLIVIAKGELKFKIARQLKSGEVERNKEVITALANLMIEKQADVLSIDSFIRTHQVDENKNPEVEQVIECFEEIAQRGNCCVHLWHHTRKGKGDGQGATVESSRGASAFIDGCRSVRVLETMSEKQAAHFGIEINHRQYFRAFSGKRNFAPHIEDSNWFYIASVELMNGPPNFPTDGDSIGVVEKWEPPSVETTAEMVEQIRQALASGQWRESVQAAMWAGKAIAPIVNLNPDSDRATIKELINDLIRDGILETVSGQDEKRRSRLFVVPGKVKVTPVATPNVAPEATTEPQSNVTPLLKIRVMGSCGEDEICLHCRKSGNVKRITNASKPGSKSETLHEECAPKWFWKYH